MSGGAKNIFVSDCSFIGTDKGLRFKTTRGRGGVVEKIYVKNINMSNIVQEAIYFDMYYWTQPPLPNQKVDVPKVSIKTPQFKDIEISNIVCNGASKGVFIRGLPEMAVDNIQMDNLRLNVTKAIEITDAKNIAIKNSNILAADKETSVYIENGADIMLDGVKFEQAVKVSLNINGASSKDIDIQNFDRPKSEIQPVFNHGATEKSINF
jgi:polygalacturonase